jgi:hypothetical protein
MFFPQKTKDSVVKTRLFLVFFVAYSIFLLVIHYVWVDLTAVILANVLSYFEPLRQLIQNGIKEGFIPPQNASLITFIDGPENPEDQESFDWGVAVIEALESWDKSQFISLDYNWTSRADGASAKEGLDST